MLGSLKRDHDIKPNTKTISPGELINKIKKHFGLTSKYQI